MDLQDYNKNSRILNVYDFDETILKGDTEVYFLRYVFSHYKISIKARIKFFKNWLAHKRKKISRKEYLNGRYKHLHEVKNIPQIVEKFWRKYKKYIKKWYLDIHKDDDVVISSTPKFLLVPIMRELGIKSWFATEFDYENSEVIGEVAFGEEKKKIFLENFPNCTINKFYSDSLSDSPLAFIAKEAYIVKDNRFENWARK